MCSSVPMGIWRTSVVEGLVDALTYGGYEGMEDCPFALHFCITCSLMFHLLMHHTFTESG